MKFLFNRFILCAGSICILSSLKSQELFIGNKMPDFQFQNVLNAKDKKVKLSDYKGKLVILDFWATTCKACIEQFPHMEYLQKRFKDSIQIFLVDPFDPKAESEDKIRSFLKKFEERTGNKVSLPIPINDTLLNVYFPNRFIPHEVWIDSSGTVVAITSQFEVTETNIQLMLAGKKVYLPVKRDEYDYKTPMYVNDNGGNGDEFIYRSMFTEYKSGLGGVGKRRNEQNEITGAYYYNYPLIDFVYHAYSDYGFIRTRTRTILDVRNSLQFGKLTDSLVKKYSYCYDLTIPPVPAKQFDIKKYLRLDLERVFNIKVLKEKRLIKSLVLKTTANLFGAYTKFDTPEFDMQSSTEKKFMHNWSISQVVLYLNGFSEYPLIDETTLLKNIDIDFPPNFNLYDGDELIKFFKNIGFDVIEENRELEVLIITDKE